MNEKFDRELAELPPERRWREWMARIEATVFASAHPVSRADLAKLVGAEASVELLIADVSTELEGRPYQLVRVADAWMFQTRSRYAEAIAAAADAKDAVDLTERELAVLAAIAYHQPIDRAGLADIFGKEVSRDLLGRLRAHRLITTGPRSPRRGAPQTFVTTDLFLATFSLENLRDLTETEGGAED